MWKTQVTSSGFSHDSASIGLKVPSSWRRIGDSKRFRWTFRVGVSFAMLASKVVTSPDCAMTTVFGAPQREAAAAGFLAGASWPAAAPWPPGAAWLVAPAGVEAAG